MTHADIEVEREPFPLDELPSRLAAMGLPRPTYKTCRRWATRGRRGICLPTKREDGRLFTTLAHVSHFLERAGLA